MSLDLAAEDASLDRRAERDDLVRVDRHVRVFPRELLHERAHRGDARGAADEDHLVDLVER